MTVIETLEELSNAFGVVGREEEVRRLMKQLLLPHVDEIEEDALGNIIGCKTGKTKAPKVMLAAHMDEIGLLVKTISKDGFLGFTKMGGIDDRILLARKVNVYTDGGPLHGVISSKPIHIQKEEERKKIITYDNLFIDVGAESREDAVKKGVKVGNPVGFDITFSKVDEETFVGKAFDDRVGCAVMVETLKLLGDSEIPVYAVGTVQEEVGLRGAATAAYRIHPDLGVAIDVTLAGGVPGVKENEAPIKMRQGPSLTVADRGLITHPKALKLLVDTAEENGIPYQLETGLPGATDAAKISLTREGVPSCVISIPTRYVHSPAEMVSLRDVDNAVKLATSVLPKIPDYFPP
jgi:endoglucanase